MVKIIVRDSNCLLSCAGAESWRSRLQAGLQEILSRLLLTETEPRANTGSQRHSRRTLCFWLTIPFSCGPFTHLSICPSIPSPIQSPFGETPPHPRQSVCLTLPKPTQPIIILLGAARASPVCLSSENMALCSFCLRVGALLINEFRCVGCLHAASVGVADLIM